MSFSLKLGSRHHSFNDLRTLLAKASGDELAGVAARDAEKRVAAQMLLANLILEAFPAPH